MKGKEGTKGIIDNMGRIVIPKAYREILGIGEQEEINLFLTNNSIVMKKNSKECSYCNCNDEKNLSEFKGRYICYDCYRELFERLNITI